MAATLSVTESQLFLALGDFISGLVSCEVIRGMQNRATMPQEDFIAMSPASMAPLATPVMRWSDTQATYGQSKQWTAQIDCYGESANDAANLLIMMFRTPYACDAFSAYGWGLQPLYAEDPQQMPLVAGEEQYVERWTFKAVLQYNPTVSVPQESANTISVGNVSIGSSGQQPSEASTSGIINVDMQYPPGAN